MRRGREYVAWLRRRYPRAFSRKRRPPLVRRVYQILLADPDRPAWATDAVVQWALARWCRHPDYLRGVVAGKWRRLLDGTPVVRVEGSGRRAAAETLAVSSSADESHERCVAAHAARRAGSLAGSEPHKIPRGNA